MVLVGEHLGDIAGIDQHISQKISSSLMSQMDQSELVVFKDKSKESFVKICMH